MKRPLRTHNTQAVRDSLTRVLNECRRGELTPAQTNAITATLNVILQSMRLDDMTQRINELEAVLQRLEAGCD